MEHNILVVDDSSVMRRMIIKTLYLSNIEIGTIYEAGDGKKAFDMLKQHSINLLFIDVNMPVMDGMKLLEIIREDPLKKNLPIFIISTESNKNRIDFIKNMGAEFLHKPFTPEDLRSKIINIMELQNYNSNGEVSP